MSIFNYDFFAKLSIDIGVHDIFREIVALYKVMQIHNFFEPIVQGEESPNQVFCHVLLMMRCPYLIMLPWVL